MPENININGDGTPIQNLEGLVIPPTTILPQTQNYNSTIAPSSAEAVATSWNAQAPSIAPPEMYSSFSSNAPELIALKANQQQNEAMLSMLEKWNDAVKENHERMIKESLDPDKVRDEEERRQVAGLVSNYLANSNPATDSSIPFLTVGLIFAGSSGGVIDAVMIDTSSTRMVGVNPTQDGTGNTQVQPDMREWLSILGAAMVQGMFYASSAFAVGKAESTQEQNKLTAEEYAQTVINLISSGQLNKLISTFVQAKSETQKADPDYVKMLEIKMQIFLLGTALYTLYAAGKGGTQHMAGEEMAGYFTEVPENQTFGPNKELMDKILGMMKDNLATLDPASKANILNALYAFINNYSAAKVLSNPASLFPNFNGLTEDFARAKRENPLDV
jgi:hypothetical protein